jgi:hypothetical protein
MLTAISTFHLFECHPLKCLGGTGHFSLLAKALLVFDGAELLTNVFTLE